MVKENGHLLGLIRSYHGMRAVQFARIIRFSLLIHGVEGRVKIRALWLLCEDNGGIFCHNQLNRCIGTSYDLWL